MKHPDKLYKAFANVTRLHYLKHHEVSEEIGVFHGQLRLLFNLAEREEAPSQRELSKEMKISPATLNVMVKSMEKEGYIFKKKDTRDQRVTRIYITDKGSEKYTEVIKKFDTVGTDYFGSLSEEEKEILIVFLVR